MGNTREASTELQDISQKVMQITTNIAETAVKAAAALPEKNKLDAIYATASSVIGALQVLALVVSRTEEDGSLKEAPEAINLTTLAFAAMLALKMMRGVHDAGEATKATENGDAPAHKVDLEVGFGPDIVLEAVEATTRLLGRQVEDALDVSLVKGAREIIAEESLGLDDLLARLRDIPPTSAIN